MISRVKAWLVDGSVTLCFCCGSLVLIDTENNWNNWNCFVCIAISLATDSGPMPDAIDDHFSLHPNKLDKKSQQFNNINHLIPGRAVPDKLTASLHIL